LTERIQRPLAELKCCIRFGLQVKKVPVIPRFR
jgi:hypothetical protein